MMEGKDHVADRISDLPCSLLTHILSFLQTKEAVQTCILSKRWTNVWALSVLRLDDRKFNEAAKSEEEYRECEAKFLRFVDAVFNHREIQPLVMFSLSWKGRSRDQVFKVLCRGVKCMPRVISISVYTYANFDLPDSIFTSVSVEEMSLSIRNSNNRSRRLFRSYHILGNCPDPKSINLPSLKKLELGDMEINDTFIVMILSGCPLLEELVMNRCSLDVREISSDKLKKLALNECFLYRKTQILCPGVVSLRIRCRDRRGITFKNMSSLANADVYFQGVDFNSKGYSNYHNLKLVGGLSNVTSLRLHMISYFELDKLVEERSNSPPFNNLTSLTLKIEFSPSIYDWCLVDWFLQHSPNLKKLTLHFSRPIKDALQQKILRVLSIEREYLETVVIIGHEDISTKSAGELVSTLGTLVKKIGRITVDLSLTSTKLAGDLAFALDARGRVLNWLLLD